MLEVIAEKDLCDTKADILNDHLTGAIQYAKNYPKETFIPYILNPRVGLEMLTPYRNFLNHN